MRRTRPPSVRQRRVASFSPFHAPPGETTTVQNGWGDVVFYRGFPCSLVLRLGSGADLLSTAPRGKEYGAVEWREDGIVYSSLHDDRMRRQWTDGGVEFEADCEARVRRRLESSVETMCSIGP